MRNGGRARIDLTTKPVLHGDNGATLKATTVLAMLYWLGVKPSYSRPRVSDDNAYAEALIRTAKYRPEFPVKGFADLAQARRWAVAFVHWYNVDHRHSGIRYVSPAQRHAGEDHAILAARHAVYLEARATKSGALVAPHPQLDAHRGGHVQPREGLGGQHRVEVDESNRVGRMTEATTTLTRAGAARRSKPGPTRTGRTLLQN